MKWARYNTQNEYHDKRHQEDRKLSAYQLVCKVQPVLPLLGLILTSRPKVGWSQFGMFITGWLRRAKSSVFTVVMYVEISTNENMAFQRNELFFLKYFSR